MKKIIKRSTALALGAMFAVGFTACGDKKTENGASGNVNTEVFSVPATEKVLRNIEYTGTKGAAAVNVTACKGEYESGQLMLRPDNNVKCYNATMGALKSGENVFPAENVVVNHEFYVDVTKTYNNNGFVPGEYPDGLAPMENAVAIGDTSIEKGDYQGIYITFNVPNGQPAGEYKGSMELDIDGKKQSIPVTLTVLDLEVSETNHTRSKVNLVEEREFGQMDSSQEMYEKYVDALVEYRLAPNLLMPFTHLTSPEAYAEVAYKYCVNPRFSNYNIPLVSKASGAYQVVDEAAFKKYVDALVAKSLETGCNLLAKAIYTSGYIDEPQLHPEVGVEGTASYTNSYRTALANCFAEYTTKLNANELEVCATDYTGKNLSATEKADFAADLVASIEEIPIVVTISYTEEYDPYVDTWCAYFDRYDTEEQRAQYADQKERWWYGCNLPHSPYPTYHIDDSLISARSVGWMMAEYDIKGNLYWASTRWENANGDYVDDWYGHANDYAGLSYLHSNGEGTLYYPGIKYGIDGPIPTIRVEAIRDGNEEYELWYAIDEQMKAVKSSYDVEDAIRLTAKEFYSGTKVKPNNEHFASSRALLLQLAQLAKENTFVTKFEQSKAGYTLSLYSEAAEVKFNGEALSGTVMGAGKEYTVTVAADKADNYAKFAFDGEELSFRLGGNINNYTANDMLGGFAKGSATVQAALNGEEVGGVAAGGLVRLSIGKATDEAQTVTFAGDVITTVGAKTSKIVMELYVDEENLAFAVMVASSGKKTYTIAIDGVTLKKGWNTVTIENVDALDWDKMKTISALVLRFGGANGSAARDTVYVKEVTVYGK